MVRNKHNTPGIIKHPFWRMTYQDPRAMYACINYGDAETGMVFTMEFYIF